MSAPMNEKNQELIWFREPLQIFEKLFMSLFALVGFKATEVGEALFISHNRVMVFMVFLITLYFLLWLLAAMLIESGQVLQTVLFSLNLLVGSLISTLICLVISPLTAWLTFLSWLAFYGVTAYHNKQKLSKLVVHTLDTIKKWFPRNEDIVFP